MKFMIKLFLVGLVLSFAILTLGCGADCEIEEAAIGRWSGTGISFPWAGTFPVETIINNDHTARIEAYLTMSGYPLNFVYNCEDVCGDYGPPFKIRASCSGEQAAASSGSNAFCANVGDDGRLSMWIYDDRGECPNDINEDGSGFMGSLSQ